MINTFHLQGLLTQENQDRNSTILWGLLSFPAWKSP